VQWAQNDMVPRFCISTLHELCSDLEAGSSRALMDSRAVNLAKSCTTAVIATTTSCYAAVKASQLPCWNCLNCHA
jgi:hypothetical protein